jgi:hypothetical protein
MDKSRLSGWETMVSSDGNVLQSGAKSRPANKAVDVEDTKGWITRAVVLQVYYPEEDTRIGWSKISQKCILCDVRTYGRYSRFLPKVPVLQRTHGVWDHDIYIPRASTIHLEAGDLASDPSADKPPTAAEDMDGDHVLVEFLEGDPQQPVILPFVMPHPKSNYRPEKADSRARRIRHNGVLVEWDAEGNLTVDARGAAKQELGERGVEQSNSGTGGKVTLVTSDGSNQTSVVLNENGQILLGSDPGGPASDEPLVLGNLWAEVMGELLDAISALTVGTGVGPSSPPINAAAFTAIKTKIQAATHLSDFIFARKSY